MVNKKSKAKLLLHTCCAPCLISVFPQLKDIFDISLYWFNPNIYPKKEYELRLLQLRKYANSIGIQLIANDNYEEDNFFWSRLTQKYSNEPEGGIRCIKCIDYRLLETARIAKEKGFDYFATTLTVSPHKDAIAINLSGTKIESQFQGLKFLSADFKKDYDHKKTIEICKELDIYRQKYCGCIYSLGTNN